MKATLLLLACLITIPSFAQPGSSYARRAVRKDIERKMDSNYRQPGRKAVQDVTYENDTRYKNPNNKIQATITFTDSTFKKEKLKTAMSTSMIFGKQGEAYVTRDEMKSGQPDIQWFVFNYADKANYMVIPKDKTAMKMPLINFQKMSEKMAKKSSEDMESREGASLEATNEWATFNGYKARKFIYTNANGTVTDEWISTALRLDLGDNYMMGARLNTYRFPENPKYKDMANGFIVRMVSYDKDGRIRYTRTLSRFEQGKADEKYFDLSGYKIMDVLAGM